MLNFPFYGTPNVLSEWKIWSAGRPVQCLVPSSMKPWCCYLMQCVVWHCHIGECKVFSERDVICMGAYFALEPGYTFQHWWFLSRFTSCPILPLFQSFLMQCHLRTPGSRASSLVFRPFPLNTDIFTDSQNFLLYYALWMMIYLTALQFHYFKLLHNLSTQYFSRLVILCPSLLLRDTATLRCSFYIQSYYWPDANWPNYLQIVPPAVAFLYD